MSSPLVTGSFDQYESAQQASKRAHSNPNLTIEQRVRLSSLDKAVEQLKPKPNHAEAARLFSNPDSFKDENEARAAVGLYLNASTGRNDRDPVSQFYAGGVPPTDVKKIISDAAEYARAWDPTDSYVGKGREAFDKDTESRAAELAKMESRQNAIITRGPNAISRPAKEVPVTDKHREQARKELFKNDRLLQVQSYMQDLSPETQQKVRVMPWTFSEPTFRTMFESIPESERPLAAAAIQASAPDETRVSTMLARVAGHALDVAIRDSARYLQTQGTNIKENFTQILPAHRYMGKIQAEFGNDMNLPNGDPIFADGEFASEEARDAVKRMIMAQPGIDVNYALQGLDELPKNIAKYQGMLKEQDFSRMIMQALNPRRNDDINIATDLAASTLEILPASALMALPVALSGGSIAAGVLGGMIIQGDQLKAQFMSAGFNSSQADGLVTVLNPFVAGLEYLGYQAMFGTPTGKLFVDGLKANYTKLAMGVIFKGFALGAVEETGTEVLQSLIPDLVNVYAREFMDIQGITNQEMIDDLKETAIQTLKGMPGLIGPRHTLRLAGLATHKATGGKVGFGETAGMADLAQAYNRYREGLSEVNDTYQFTQDENGNVHIIIPNETETRTSIPMAVYLQYRGAQTDEERSAILGKNARQMMMTVPELQTRIEALVEIEGKFTKQIRAALFQVYQGTVGEGFDPDGKPLGWMAHRQVAIVNRINAQIKDNTSAGDVLQQMLDKYGDGRAKVIVVGSVEELANHPEASAQLRSDAAGGADIDGAVDGDNVFLVNPTDAGATVAKFAHEYLVHAGLDSMGTMREEILGEAATVLGVGGYLESYINTLANLNPIYAEQFSQDPNKAIEEILARTAEGMLHGGTLDIQQKNLWGKLRELIGKTMGIETAAEWTDRNMARLVQDIIRNGGTDNTAERGGLRYSTSVRALERAGVPLRIDGKLQLTHWSPVEDLETLEPDQFGTGPLNGAERKRSGIGFLPRVQFGLAGYIRELEAENRYHASVDPNTLYPMNEDPDNLKRQAQMQIGERGDGTPIYSGAVDLNVYEQLIFAAGYKGVIGHGNFGPVVSMFVPVKIEVAVKDAEMATAPVEVDANGKDLLEGNMRLQNIKYLANKLYRDAGSPEMPNLNYSLGARPVDALGFYSPIRAEVEAMDFKQIPPRQLADRIRKLPKQEEMEDLGLYDWLELQDGKVTKEAVLAFIDQGGVQLNQIINSDAELEANTPEFYFGNQVQEEHDMDFIRQMAEENLDNFIAESDERQDDLENGVKTREDLLEEAMEQEVEQRYEDLGSSQDVEVIVGDKTFIFQWVWSPLDGNELYSQTFQESIVEFGEEGFMDQPVVQAKIREFLKEKGEIRDTEEMEPQYETYVMEGPSSNYREFILTLPVLTEPSMLQARQWYETGVYKERYSKKDIPWNELPQEAKEEVYDAFRRNQNIDTFTHGHWPGVQNPLVHFRTTDRQVDGKPTLFLEEIQSDWIQQGRKKGFKREVPAELKKEREDLNNKLDEIQGKVYELDQPGPRTDETGQRRQALVTEGSNIRARLNTLQLEIQRHSGIPDPGAFKRSGTVDLLAFKRALAIAVAEGYDNIAWTPAIEQIRRWSDSLQQEVRSIEWAPSKPKEDGSATDWAGVVEVDTMRAGRMVHIYYDAQGEIKSASSNELVGKTLSEVFDNSIAKQILTEPEGRLEGDGLTIGGKGFKDFYDGLLPREVKKYVKKMGGRVGIGGAQFREDPFGVASEDVTHQEVWNVEITDQMRGEVSMGQPIYSLSAAEAADMQFIIPGTTRQIDHLSNYIGLEHILQNPNPKKLKLLVKVLKRYPGFVTKSSNPEKVLNEFVSHLTNNLLFLYHSVTPEVRERARKWYDGARVLIENWSKTYDLPNHAIAGVIASLSPQTDWFTNIERAERLIRINREQQGTVITERMRSAIKGLTGAETAIGNAVLNQMVGKPYAELTSIEKAAFIIAFSNENMPAGYDAYTPEGHSIGRALNQDGSEKAFKWGTLTQIAKGIDIIANPESMSELLGENAHKIRNFYNNMLAPNGDTKSVTIDTHAVAAATLMALAGDDGLVGHNFGSSVSAKAYDRDFWEGQGLGLSAPTSKVNGANGTYGLYAEAYRRAARTVGILPRELQSITWEAVRGLFSDTFKKDVNNKIKIEKILNNKDTSVHEKRSQVIEAAGGITDPVWVGQDGKESAGQNRSGAQQGELPSAGVHGSAYRSGDGSGTAGSDAGVAGQWSEEGQMKTIREIAARETEGFTFKLNEGQVIPKSRAGYVVAYADTQNQFGPEGLAFAIDHAKTKGEGVVGGWTEQSTGKVYYDSSRIIQDEQEALDWGREQDQFAIYDIKFHRIFEYDKGVWENLPDPRYSLGASPHASIDNTLSASIELALRMLEGQTISRETARQILAESHPNANVDRALNNAYTTARNMRPSWDRVRSSTDQSMSSILSQQGTAVHAGDSADKLINESRNQLKKQYLHGVRDQEIRTHEEDIHQRRVQQVHALNKEELEQEGLRITDPVAQLDLTEEALYPNRTKEEKAAAEENADQDVSISEEEIQATPVPTKVTDYLKKIRAAVTRKTNFKDSSSDFMLAYRTTLVNALRDTIRALNYGRSRESLLNAIDQMGRLTQVDAIERRASQILTKAFQVGAHTDRKSLVQKLEKAINKRTGKHPPSERTAWAKDKVPKILAKQLRLAKKWMKASIEEVETRIDEVQLEIENGLPTHQRAANRDQAFNTAEDELTDLQMELDILERFGALNKYYDDKTPYRTIAEISETVDKAIEEIEAAVTELQKRISEKQEQLEKRRSDIIDGVSAAAGKVTKSAIGKKVGEWLRFPMSLHWQLFDLIRFAKGDLHNMLWNDKVVPEGDTWSLKKLSRDVRIAEVAIRKRKYRDLNELLQAIGTIYGARTYSGRMGVLKSLMTPRRKYQSLSKRPNPQGVSKAHLIQWLAFMEQEFYAENVKKHGREGQAAEIRRMLSAQDLQLLDFFRDFYKRQRPELSAQKKKITGIGFPTDFDPLYMPVTIDKLGGFRGINTGVQFTPPIYSDRRRHSQDLKETEDVISIFLNRSHKNAVYMELTKTAMEVSEVFGNAEVQKTIRGVYGEKYWDFFQQMLFDAMTQKPLRYDVDSGNAWILNYGAIAMWFNLRSAIRQPSSMFEYGIDHSAWDLVKWSTNLLNPTMLPIIKKVYFSEEAVARRAAGPSYQEALAEDIHLTEKGDSVSGFLKALLKKVGMAPNKIMDAMTISTIGAGVYKEYYDRFLELGMSEEEASQKAMDWLWAETETHQQSNLVSNQAPWQRSGGVWDKALRMFTSTPQQFLAIQNAALRRGQASGDWAPLARSIAIHHILGPALYKTLELIFNTMLGRKPDEDEWKEWVAFFIVGPYAGSFLGRYIFSQVIDQALHIDKFMGGAEIPAERLLEATAEALSMASSIAEGDGEAVIQTVSKVAELLPPVQYAKEIKENYLD